MHWADSLPQLKHTSAGNFFLIAGPCAIEGEQMAFDIAGQVITIGRDFHDSNANMRAAVLVHEAGHFADASCSHAASEQPAPQGSPITDKFGTVVNPGRLDYAHLDFELHMRNAYSFAQCAMHNGLGVDKRPP